MLEHLVRGGGSPIGQAGLARETGLANNTVASGYVEMLADLLCVGQAQAWDASRRIRLARKPCKYPFINLLAAAAWHPARPRSVQDFRELPESTQATLLEWLVAQEVWRGRASPLEFSWFGKPTEAAGSAPSRSLRDGRGRLRQALAF
ncbi:MAG: hypothetical protein HY554_12705 [Elusimicrobia bacterium]|nr:hypothetical protein [Elusimicrobiota bacterium]